MACLGEVRSRREAVIEWAANGGPLFDPEPPFAIVVVAFRSCPVWVITGSVAAGAAGW
jgi:hypothetical protein